jgi:hypothetical protein
MEEVVMHIKYDTFNAPQKNNELNLPHIISSRLFPCSVLSSLTSLLLRSWMPETTSRASLVLLHQTHYHDSLLRDMCIAHRRKGPNWVAELFAPYQGGDYDGIFGQKKA